MKLHVDLKERGYDIVMERGVLHRLAQEVDLNRNVLLVSDSKVPVQWIEAVKEQCPHCVVKIVPSGEESKSFAVWEELLSCMLEHHFLRSDLVIALGGGVVGVEDSGREIFLRSDQPSIGRKYIFFPNLDLHRGSCIHLSGSPG